MEARHRRPASWFFLSWGWILTLIAFAAANVTIAHGSQTVPLTIAFVGAALAMLLFAAAFRHGRVVVRVLAFLGAIPVGYVFLEFARQAHTL